ncbi:MULTISPECIES: hypothetical protein [Caballeronia]|uniref:hypothetical protein n=1 Tax=Caballeronia TaxID=1827195 RepID=UPI001EF653D4|nr:MULTISPECIES: hypothetical protein [Caballeronia]MCG7400485.1 hypothetical protein [Caballeronia zhejiangensis]
MNADQKLLKSFDAAKRYLVAAADFKNATGFDPGKANEILSAMLANAWFAKAGFKWRIDPLSRPRGADGTLLIDGADSGLLVEFKSSKQTSSEFQFSPDFDFGRHGCVVMTEFRDGLPKRIYLAIGAETMKELRSRLDDDGHRATFDREKHNLRLFATDRSADEIRHCAVRGLLRTPVKDTGPEDRVIILESEAISELMQVCSLAAAEGEC